MYRRSTSYVLVSLLSACIGCNQTILSPGYVGTRGGSVPIAANWQVFSSDPSAAMLPSFSGAFAGSDFVTGIVHTNSPSACISPTTAIKLTGFVDAANHITLTGADVAGGTLTITGTLAQDAKSISSATYTVTGGTCAFTRPAVATAQSFSSITGNYTGTFSDADGQVLTISAMLTQNPASDTSGNFQLSGTGTLGTNPCFSSPANVSNSQVTGGSFTLTYNDPGGANSVNASGTFSMDGTTLTVTNWALSGACGADSGTGILTRH